MVAIYGWVFFHAKLYSDTLLQVFFFARQHLWLVQWRRSQVDDGRRRGRAIGAAARGCAGSRRSSSRSRGWGWLMHRFTDAALPWWDAGVAMTSVAAQILMARRKLENWWLWIAVDVAVDRALRGQGPVAHAGFTSVLLGLAIWGLARWQAARQEGRRMKLRSICLHGPESTGKSTMAPELARHFGSACVVEYGRTYTEAFGTGWTMGDLVAIAQAHDAQTRSAIASGRTPVILDTDPLMTEVWAEMLYGKHDPWFDAWTGTADLYLLFDIDLPWVEDGTRMFGTPERRQRFFDLSKRSARTPRRALGDGERARARRATRPRCSAILGTEKAMAGA